MLRGFLPLVLLTCLAGVVLPAVAKDPVAPLYQQPVYFPADIFDKLLSAPPTNDSIETRTELDRLLDLQDSARTDEQQKLINAEALGPSLESYFDLLAADYINTKSGKYKNTKKLLAITNKEVGYFVFRAKEKFKRARPTTLEPKLEPLSPVPPSTSYPSGNAAQAMTGALILAQLDPQRADLYLKKALDIGYRREVAGLHFSSDTKAGQKLASALVAELLKNPALADLFKLAREEFPAQ
jgi:acid phosphatase (class A)